MFLDIPDVLSPEQVADIRHLLDTAQWVDGRGAAGDLTESCSLRLADSDPLTWRLGDMIVDALGRSERFASTALPLRVFPPSFERDRGEWYGGRVDDAIRHLPGTPLQMRVDLSATLFLTEPDEYDGGDLVIDDASGTHAVKGPAGHVVLYPASSRHTIRPVTRGTRLAARFWIQSLVGDDRQRALLFEFDAARRALMATTVDRAVIAQIDRLSQSLLRRWASL